MKSTSISRSYSHDINIFCNENRPKSSLSDNSLDTGKMRQALKPMTIKEQPSASIEDDICSTDSSVLDDSELKKKKRKLFTFSKKGKNKGE